MDPPQLIYWLSGVMDAQYASPGVPGLLSLQACTLLCRLGLHTQSALMISL